MTYMGDPRAGQEEDSEQDKREVPRVQSMYNSRGRSSDYTQRRQTLFAPCAVDEGYRRRDSIHGLHDEGARDYRMSDPCVVRVSRQGTFAAGAKHNEHRL